MSKTQIAYYKSPIGTLEITGGSKGIYSIIFVDETSENPSQVIATEIQNCIQQLDEYFKGTRKEFELKLAPKGTKFQGKVWKELLKVPYGKTKSYSQQSIALGDLKAIRAVATANGKNPISIIIPCHRIIGSDGSLTGYAGGIWRKKWLLEHEGVLKKQTSLF